MRKIKIESVRTDDHTMEYFKFGEGKEVLVILPGLSVQSVMSLANSIASAYRVFSEKYTVYVFERRKELPEPYTVADSARDTVQAFRGLGLDRVRLFGASYGGMVSMTIAARHPELVEKMALASTSAHVTAEAFETIEGWIRLAREGDAKGLYLAFGEALYAKEMFEILRDFLIDLAETVTEEELRKFRILAEGIKDFDITPELDQIRCPVLAIGDRQDRVLKDALTETIARNMEKRADFEVFMYDGYGHAAYDMAPDYKERLLRFFTA